MALDTDIPQGTFEHIESLIRESAADLDKGIREKNSVTYSRFNVVITSKQPLNTVIF